MNDASTQPEKPRAGYQYLLTYKLSVPIYDLTYQFCIRYIPKTSRTFDQMIQAARSGMQNIIEGNKQQGISGYIKLTGIARGSLEELLQDYLAYARQNDLHIWSAEKSKREISEIGEIWKIIKASSTLSNQPNFPNLPTDIRKAVNMLITLINQEGYLLDKLIASLKEKHMKTGGLTEELYRKRKAYRGY